MHEFSEIDQYMLLSLLLATASGALAGIIVQLINDIFSKIENQLKSYPRASFMFGIPMGGLTFLLVIFNTDTPVKYVKQYFVAFAIIGGTLIALATKIF